MKTRFINASAAVGLLTVALVVAPVQAQAPAPIVDWVLDLNIPAEDPDNENFGLGITQEIDSLHYFGGIHSTITSFDG